MGHFYPIKFNMDSCRFRIPMEGVTNCYVTPNHNYFAVEIKTNGNEVLSIWNLQTMSRVAKYKIENRYWLGQRALTGTLDS